MVAILKQGTTESQIEKLSKWLGEQGVGVHIVHGEHSTIIGLIGDTSKIDADLLASLDMISSVKRISVPYKKANRMFHPDDTVVDVSGVKIGGGNFALIAGPCSVESIEQVTEIARGVKAAGATLFRGGAFKPRTSPYDFQGLRDEGIKMLMQVKRETGLPIVTEIMSTDHLPLFENVDLIQVGARNMQNFELLRELGKINKPILLKRGLASTIKEFIMSAEYIMAGGNEQIILCERGIRTYETATRNTLDLSAVPVLHELTHLPVVVDPSHATGVAKFVRPMAVAAAAVGADGLMIEVHNNPEKALCDGAQSVTPDAFAEIAARVNEVREVVARQN